VTLATTAAATEPAEFRPWELEVRSFDLGERRLLIVRQEAERLLVGFLPHLLEAFKRISPFSASRSRRRTAFTATSTAANTELAALLFLLGRNGLRLVFGQFELCRDGFVAQRGEHADSLHPQSAQTLHLSVVQDFR